MIDGKQHHRNTTDKKGSASLNIDEARAASEAINQFPLVSVIIPYYSQGAYIAETIESVRRQTYPNIELIVVDDESAQDHENALRKIEGIEIYRIRNSGPPAARNYGFKRSAGEYLVFLDADDVLPDQAIEKNLETLLEHPEASLVFGAVQVIDSAGRVLVPDHVCLPRRNYFLMLLETNPICSPGATMMRRSAFEQAGKFVELGQFQVDDYELYLQIAKYGSLCQQDDCVLRYRRHDTNMSKDRARMLMATLDSLNRVASLHHFSHLERLQLWHGRRRWNYEFIEPPATLLGLRPLYYKFATSWNIDLVGVLRMWLRRYLRKCGCKPTRRAFGFIDSKASTRDAACGR